MATKNDKFSEALTTFAESIKSNFSLQVQAQPEDQLKAPTIEFVKKFGEAVHLDVDARTEVQVDDLGGRPDIGVTVRKLVCGHIELKAPRHGVDARRFRGHDKKQWEKFQALPNLIYSDGNEWVLYRNGARTGNLVRFEGDITELGAGAFTADQADALELILRDFLQWEPIVPSTRKALADMLAPLCRILRDEVMAAIQKPDSPLNVLKGEWREYLFPDTDDAQFADAYAQTLTYALLLARFSGATSLNVSSAVIALREGHGLLSQALKILGDEQARPEIEMPLSLLERSIGAVDVAKLTRKGRDPWLYFYEEFLSVYDPKLRKDRGVYFTPVQVVQAQVNFVSRLLIDKFDKPLSFADKGVVFLDPATGTGTYPLTAIQHGLSLVRAKYGEGMVAERATQIAKNMHAFEILVGPYSVTHMRLSQEIREEGGMLPEKGIQVFLTDTLESPYAQPPRMDDLSHRALTEEHRRAAKAKADTRILVCLGNPPYDRQTIEPDEADTVDRKGGWIRKGDPAKKIEPLLEAFLNPLREAGQGVHAKNLYNDYVYFWRWALWKIFEESQGPGIVSFITASSYMKGPGFIGMRQMMRQTFDDLWIVDLEGDNLGARRTENVFNIQNPVAIAVGVRYGEPAPGTSAKVRYCKITGTEKEKLAKLASVADFSDLDWLDCFSGWGEPFLPIGSGDYFSWPLLTDIFPWQQSGVQMKRTWVIGESMEVLKKRVSTLISEVPENRKRLFRETRDRKIDRTYLNLAGVDLAPVSIIDNPENIEPPSPYGFRSFDRQLVIPDARMGDFLRPVFWICYGQRQIFLTSLLTGVVGLGPATTVTSNIPDLHHFRGSYGGKDAIPLWRDAEATQPNLTERLTECLEDSLGFTPSSEDIFAYVYSLMASPAYVERFSEELTVPGPRIPITKDGELFRQSVGFGQKLIWLHTYGERMVPKGRKPGQVPQGAARCTKAVPQEPEEYPDEFEYDETKMTLIVGEGVFKPVSKAVWEFSVSGLEVVKSWLGYRMKSGAGKKSSPLDNIRPERWTFTKELLELLWVLEATVDMFPSLEANLDAVLASSVFLADELPKPSEAERKAPVVDRSPPEQQEMALPDGN